MPHSRLVPILISAILAVATASCGDTFPRKEAIYAATDIEVYTDSIVLDGKIYDAISRREITNSWISAPDTCALTFASDSKMADALFAKSLEENMSQSVPSVDEIFLSTAILAPAKSMETLRHMVVDGRLSQQAPTGFSDNYSWGAAAWEVYCTTGDKKWLREAYGIIISTLNADRPAGQLVQGIPSYMAPAKDHFPVWMETSDLMQVRSLGINVWRFHTLRVAADMADQLGLPTAVSLRQEATRLRNLINDNFWDPALSRYKAYLYGNMYPILSGCTDNLAGALCSIFSIATPEMGAACIKSTDAISGGIPLIYPSSRPEGTISSHVQALHGLAASTVRDASSLCRALGSLWAICLEEEDPASWPALLLRGIMGISLKPDGIHISPFVPNGFHGDKHLSGLRYRDAVINLTVSGTGDRVASVEIDGEPSASAFIPASLDGEHDVTVTMSGNTLPQHSHNQAPEATFPPMPKLYWSTERTATILNHTAGTSYDVYINGVLTETLSTGQYTVTGGGTQIIDIVPVTENPAVRGFSPRSHICASRDDIISIPATSITPRRSPLHLIKNRDIATRYIELAARHNTRLTFYVNAPSSGDYFLDITYSNGTTETALRSVEVNSSIAGTIVCPPVRHNDWISTRRSTTLTVPLREGSNKLSLYYINSTILLNGINLLKK